MKLGLSFVTAVTVMLVGSSADAAVLTTDKECYREGVLTRRDIPPANQLDPVVFGGGPFTPRGRVNVARDGLLFPPPLEVDATGNFGGIFSSAPIIDPVKQRPFTLVATDETNRALTGTVTRLVSMLDVTVRPDGGRPAIMRRISARGFTAGGALYAHIVRGQRRRNVWIGTLTGPCGTLAVKRRVFRKGTQNGRYRVQFDTSRRFAPRTYPSMVFYVTISTVFRGEASSSRTAERWVRVD